MASRKEEKERLRQERLESERQASASARKRLMLGYVVAGLLAAAIAVGVIVAIVSGGSGSSNSGGNDDSANVNTTYGVLDPDMKVDDREGTTPPPVANGDLVGASREAGCDLQTDLPDEGSTHFSDLNKVVNYKTNPPTSGDHYAANEAGSGALADGAFLTTPNWNRAVHALEHGRIEIQYSPDLPEDQQLALKGVFDSARPGVDLFPNPDMPYAVAATAWTNLVGCKDFDGAATLDVIRDFRDSFLGRGPEAIPYQ
jgi:uncharacterized protein DUF3105